MTCSDRLIQLSPRLSTSGTIVIFATVLLLSISFFLSTIPLWAVVLAIVLAAAATIIGDAQTISLSLFASTLIVLPSMHPPLRAWPFNLLVPLLLTLLASLVVPALRSSLLWMRTGSFGKEISLLVISVAALSGIALLLWHRLLKPDVTLHLAYFPDMPLWLYPLAELAFSGGNAAMEEFAFRGAIMQAIDTAVGPSRSSIIIQAWLFGAMHYLRGFPNGLWGVGMAFIYGIMLGTIRRRSRGVLAPWIAHVCADLVIFMILASIVLGKRGQQQLDIISLILQR